MNNPIGWILLIVAIGVCIWLVIDTIIYIVKKSKAKKLKKAQEVKDINKVD